MQPDPDTIDRWTSSRRDQSDAIDLTASVMKAIKKSEVAGPSQRERLSIWLSKIAGELPVSIPIASAGCGGVLRLTIVFFILLVPN